MWCFSSPSDPAAPSAGPTSPTTPTAPGPAAPSDATPEDPPPVPNPTPSDEPLVGPNGVCPCVCDDAEIVPETVVNEPADITRTRIAVGERVRLTYSKGSADWTVEGDSGPGNAPELSATSGATITLTAPGRGGSLTITATGGGCTASLTLTVVEPNVVHMFKKHTSGHIRHRQNFCEIGVLMNAFVGPVDVNFHRIQTLELEVNCVSSGIWACINNTGHEPNPNGLGFTTHVQAGMGTFWQATDHLFSGWCGGPHPAPQAGAIQWNIPWKWRVGGSGAWHNLTTVTQRATCDTSGNLTMRKAGGVGTTTFGAATSSW